MTSARFSFLLLTCAGVIGGCSAIVEPDPNRLGGARDGGGPPFDGGSVCPPSCDDSVACTADSCVAGRCAHVADDRACGAAERCNPVLGCVPARCTSAAECNDGRFCNGAERCDPAAPGDGCLPGAAPSCADAASCTIDRCDDALGRCVYEANHAACADAFDCTIDTCEPAASVDPSGCVRRADDSRCVADACTTGGTCSVVSGCTGGTPRDCSDGDPCTSDSCSGGGCVNPPRDDDGDGVPARSVLSGGTPVACGGTDCNDTNPAVRPGATETCNGVDDNCNGSIDEGCTTPPDDCASAGRITLTTSGADRVATVRRSIADLRHDYQTNAVCNAGSNGRDAVYMLEIPAGTWDITLDTIGSTFDTVLAVGAGLGASPSCTTALSQSMCSDDYDQRSVTTASRIWVHRAISPGVGGPTLFILVDAFDSSITTGDFVLNVRLTPARADQCPTMSTVPLDISGGGTVVGFQTNPTSATRGSCQAPGDTSPEAVFFFRGPSTGNADFEVYSAEFVPVAYVRAAPCASGAEVGCQVGSPIGGGINRANLRRSVTSGQPYFLFVDGGRTTYAAFYFPY